MEVAIEAKARSRISADDLKGLRALIEDHPRVRRRYIVCLETKRRRTDDGIDVLPVDAFVEELTGGRLF